MVEQDLEETVKVWNHLWGMGEVVHQTQASQAPGGPAESAGSESVVALRC